MNLAKILKNCPRGMKLYSPIYGELKYDSNKKKTRMDSQSE